VPFLSARVAAAAGQTISEKDRCPQCRGNKTVQDKKILEVNVERGMQHNQKIVFRGEADEAVRVARGARRTHALTRCVTCL
jgi:DnaJ-class molecular chaperone